jgi:hypothetical protein
MSPFQSLRDYERSVYTLQQQFPRILRSTLVVARRGRLFAELAGELTITSTFHPTLNITVFLLRI